MIRLAVRMAPAQAEVVLAQLLELAPNGVEETDGPGWVEFALYGAPGELPELPALRAAAGEALCEVVSEHLPDDWWDGWKRFHRPVRIGERLVVRPPWEPEASPGQGVDVVIDPGQAFGTGSHHTTRLCLELLCELQPGGSFLDLGCGSGVLAVAAAKLGWAPVRAVDHEVAAVQAARDNARLNGVEVEVARLDLRRQAPPGADTVAANLLRPLLLDFGRSMVRPPRWLVVSGLLRGEADEVALAFGARGLREEDRRHGGEWTALLLAAG